MEASIAESTDASAAASASLTIRDVGALHQRLLSALAERDSLNVAFADDVPVDLSFVQLIESARLYAEAHGKSFNLTKPAGGNVRRVLERGGFLPSSDARALRFWLHEEVAR